VTLADLQALYRAGEAVVPVDKAEPWTLLHVSRATFYRACQRNEVPGVLRLGRRRLLRLDLFLHWVGAPLPLADPHEREVPAAVQPPARGRDQCARDEPTP